MKTQTQNELDIQKDERWNEAAPAVRTSSSSVLENLKSNIDRLEELHSRLKFMLGEIKILVRK